MSKACSTVSHSDTSTFSNISPLARIALRQLKRLPLMILPNHKKPGFSCVTLDQFRAMELSIVSRPADLPVRPCDVPDGQTRRAAADAARRVQHFLDLPGAARDLNRSLIGGSVYAQMGINVKDHKPNGSVGVRNLHCCPNYPMKGLARWLTTERLKQIPSTHILRDSAHARSRLHGLALPSHNRLATLDIKDLFMSGDSSTLLSDRTGAFDGALLVLISEVFFLLVDSHFVSLIKTSDLVFKVVEGVGMGLLFSGAVASLRFYRRVENKIIDTDILSSSGVIA